MLFNSIEYLFFLPTVFLLYWLVFKSLRSRNILLLAASYLFYGWWDYRFLLLIFGITLVSFFGGIIINKFDTQNLIRKIVVLSVAVINLGILVIFKYFNFFAEGFVRFLSIFGMTADKVSLDIILPVGISFYTFQSLGYIIDVYRRKIPAVDNPLPFFVFISFFLNLWQVP